MRRERRVVEIAEIRCATLARRFAHESGISVRDGNLRRCTALRRPDRPASHRWCELFLAYVEQVLMPTLKPGDVVIVDKLRVHEMAAVREAIEVAGAKLPLIPPYSTDLNPIELATTQGDPLRRGVMESVGDLGDSVSPTLPP
jgi:hypothetical protein